MWFVYDCKYCHSLSSTVQSQLPPDFKKFHITLKLTLSLILFKLTVHPFHPGFYKICKEEFLYICLSVMYYTFGFSAAFSALKKPAVYQNLCQPFPFRFSCFCVSCSVADISVLHVIYCTAIKIFTFHFLLVTPRRSHYCTEVAEGISGNSNKIKSKNKFSQ